MHPLAWFVWLGTGAAATLMTRNPLYLILLLAVFVLVSDVEREDSAGVAFAPDRTLPISPLRLALLALPAGALFNVLTSHVGETVLWRLPAGIPLIGGAYTAEALIYGLVNGLLLVTLFAAFAVLNLAVSVRDLIAYIPRAFYPVAVVSAIAVTFVPTTVRQFQQVRDAQAIRGHRMRGWRDWLPLFLPVLIGGLERALQLAEAMTARGFGGPGDAGGPRGVGGASGASLSATPKARQAAGPALVLGLACILAAGVAQLLPAWGRLAPVFLMIGSGLIGWTIWRAGRGVRHTRYRRHPWRWTDGLVVLGSAMALLPLLVWGATRVYSPYPRLSWPPFDLRVGGAFLLLMTPAVVRRLGGEWGDRPRAGEVR